MNYSERILQYCNNVVADKMLNRKCCEFEKLACKRHLSDLTKQDDPDFPFYFDEDAANKRCHFTELLQHTKGKWRGQYVILEAHQLFIQGVMFGWMKKTTNTRRFSKAYIELPRKNGKSLEAATTGLYMAFVDGEPGAEVYSGAQTEAQALCTFEPAHAMVRQNKDLVEHFNLKLTGTPRNPTSIYREEDMSKFMPVVGKPGDGASPHCALIDEFHEAATSVLYDAMDTGMGARTAPLIIVITTAGVNTSFPCYDLHLEAIKVLEGTIENDSLFCMVFAPDKEDDWQNFEVWKKVNPNFGISISEDYLWNKFQDALNKPSQRNILLTKHLNIWQNAGVAWLDMLKWERCKDTSMKLEQFKGMECYVSLDLASKIDLAALVIEFRYKRSVINDSCPKCYGEVEVQNLQNVCISGKVAEDGNVCSWHKPVERDCVAAFAIHYIPEETAYKKENSHYQKWALAGHLVITEGARTDFKRIEDDIRALGEDFIIKELCFDPKEASYLIQNIETWASFECVEFPQGPSTISQPMKELEAMVYENEFWHTGDPVFTWCIGNIIKKQSRSGGSVKHYFPTKENDNLKIDSGVAAICCLGRLMENVDSVGAYQGRVSRGDERVLRVL